MKKSTKNYSRKLAQYGAMSLAIAGVADATGQVVYTDVSPDFSGSIDDVYALDLDADGNIDFNISQVGAANGVAAMIFSAPSLNGAIGVAGDYNYPSNLSSGVTVSSGKTFVNAVGTFNFSSCAYPGSMWCDGVTDGYMGVQFQISGVTHYGWVRMDINAAATAFVVKDYAYEATAGAPIDTGDDGLGIEDQIFNGFAYFIDAGQQLNLSANTPMESIQLYDLLGKRVVSQQLSQTEEIVNISALKTGVYLATISIDGAGKTFKIVKR